MSLLSLLSKSTLAVKVHKGPRTHREGGEDLDDQKTWESHSSPCGFPNRNFGKLGTLMGSIDHAGAVWWSSAHPRHIIPQQGEVAVKGQLSEIYSISFVFLIFFCIPYLLLHSYWLYIFFGKGLSHCLLNSLCSFLFIEKSSSLLHCPKPSVF